ncbi:DciA family protein [Streptomyces goshikiensis]|uniref:DciA family protein n=1 Tax=Streptomyces goshikiensis TaxID=1942 RepID=UPI0036CEA192
MNSSSNSTPAAHEPSLLTQPSADPTEDLPDVQGPDLARVMLRRAIAAAKDRPANSKPKPARRRTVRRSGRDPNTLGGILNQLVIDHQWERGKAGGTLNHQWPHLITEAQAEHWKADSYDEDTATLRVVCDTHSWAASLRLIAPKVIKDIHAKLPDTPLHHLDVQVSTGRQLSSESPREADDAPTPKPMLRTVRGDAPSEEYRQARAACRAAAASQRIADGQGGQHLVPAPESAALTRARAERTRKVTGPASTAYLHVS